MRARLLFVVFLLALPLAAMAAGIQVWAKLDGVPNYSTTLPDAMYGQNYVDRSSYGEGWFWLSSMSDGSYSFSNFMISNIGFGKNKPTVDMTVWEPSGQTYTARLPFKEGALKSVPGRMDLAIGENRISGSYPNFSFKASEKDVAIEMQYHATLPTFTINSGRVVYGSPDDYYSLYVTAPRATISGTVRTPSGTRTVTGFGYTDHGIVTMMPYDYSKRWLTLRCFDQKYTLDILEFTVPKKWGGGRVPLIVFGAGDKLVYGGSQFTLTPTGWQTEPKYGQKYPSRVDFLIDRPNKVKVEGFYTFDKLMHSVDMLSQLSTFERTVAKFFAKSYIMRFLSTVEGTVTMPDGSTDTFKTPAVAEVLYIN